MNVDFDATIEIGIANKSVIIFDNVFFPKKKIFRQCLICHVVL